MATIKRIGKYTVKSDGSIYTKTGKLRKPYLTPFGYHRIHLSFDGKKKNLFVHRIVAELFLEKVNSKNIVNHKDRNKLNNSVSNLEWCTHKENIQHTFRTGRIHLKGEDAYNSKISNGIAEQIRFIYKIGKVTQKKLSEMYDIDQSTISRIVNGKRWIKLSTLQS